MGLEVQLDRFDAVRDDVPEEEDEDAGRDGVQRDTDTRREVPHAGHREAEEDREASDRAEDEGLSGAHAFVVRHTLHAPWLRSPNGGESRDRRLPGNDLLPGV